jgi:hypothetical protein
MDKPEKMIRSIKKVMAKNARQQAASELRLAKTDRELLLMLKTAERLLARCDPDDDKGRSALRKSIAEFTPQRRKKKSG